jgi:ABC-type Mn2+/Zn2+ transport system permease subunit
MTAADLTLALELFRDPILCGVAAGVVLGWLGVHIVLRRMVFVTAALTQSAGLGVAGAFYAGIHLGLELPPLAGSLMACALAAALVTARAGRLRLSRESLLALAWLLSAGGAVLVGSRITQEAQDIAAILFGTAVLVTPEDLRAVLGVGGLALALAIWWQRGLIFAGFDPDGARVQGLPVRALELGLLALITLAVSTATRALGALPVFAFSVLPAMAALMATPHLSRAFPLAALLGGLAGAGGYLAAFLLDFPVGASQTLAAALPLLLAAPLRLLRDRG